MSIRSSLGKVRRRAMISMFGNVASMRTNVLSEAYYAVARRSYRRQGANGVGNEHRARAAEFEREGTLVFPPQLDRATLEHLRDRADALLTQPEQVVARKELVRLKGSLELFPELEAFITPDIEKTLEAYFQSHFKIYSTDIYRILPTDAKEDQSFLWHFDNGPTQLIKLMVYLDDVNAETGAFRVKPKPLSLQLKRRGFWDRKTVEPFRHVLEDQSTTKVFEAPLGTAILFHAMNCIHKATYPRTGHRDVATFLLHPSTEPWRSHLDRNRDRLSSNFGYCVNPFTDRPLRVGDE